MANIVSGVTIKAFDKFSAVMNKFDNRINAVTERTKNSRKAFDNYRTATQGATDALKRMAFVGGAALTGVAVLSTKAGMKFEDASAGFSALTGSAGESLKFMENSALSASKKYGVAAADILDANTRIASAKSELMAPDQAENLKKVTDASLMLSRISGLTAEESGKNLVNTMNLFGIASEDSSVIVDQLAQSSRRGILEVGALSTAFKMAGVQAANAGMDIAEYTSLIQVAALSGQAPGKVGTQLRNVITELTKLYPKINEGSLSVTQALDDMSKAKFTSIQLERLGFNTRDIASLQTVLLNVELLKDRITETSDIASRGEGLRMFAERTKVLSFAFQKLWAIITDKFIKLYNDFLQPILMKLTKSFGNFVEWLYSGTTAAKSFGLAMGVVATALASAFTAVSSFFIAGTMIQWATSAKLALASVGIVFNTFFGGIPLLIGAIAMALPAIWALSAWMRGDDKKGFFAVMLDDVREVWSTLTPLWDLIKGIFSSIFGVLDAAFSSFGGLGSAIGLVIKGLAVFAGILGGGLLVILASFVAFWASAFAFISMAGAALQDLYNIVVSLWGGKPIKLFDTDNLDGSGAFFKKYDDYSKAVKDGMNGTLGLSSDERLSAFNRGGFDVEDFMRSENLGVTFGDNASLSPNKGNTNIEIHIDKDGNAFAKTSEGTKPSVKMNRTTSLGGGQMGVEPSLAELGISFD
tara:strand:+ start:2022 stop:4118 length:2097 start_codon:yes stop_codon:yes gene_type:complete